jgi:hypothetical protein
MQYLGCSNYVGKTVYAQTTMTFLGIELDTTAMEARLPLDSVLKIKNSLSEMRVR